MAIHIVYISTILLFATAVRGSIVRTTFHSPSASRAHTLSALAAGEQCNATRNFCTRQGASFFNCPDTGGNCYCAATTEGTPGCFAEAFCAPSLVCESSSDCGPGFQCLPDTCCGGPPMCAPNCPANTCRAVTGGGGAGVKSPTPVCSGVCGLNSGWGCCTYDPDVADCTCFAGTDPSFVQYCDPNKAPPYY